MYSFASISILALCCYTFLLAAFMAARKTPIGNAFIMALISGVLWTGGSFCMRIQLFPGVNFWYQVSLTGMLLICFAFCWFLMEFTDHRNVFLKKMCIRDSYCTAHERFRIYSVTTECIPAQYGP